MLILEVIMSVFSIVSNIAIVITMIYGIMKFKQDKQSVIADLEWRRKNETILFSCEILEKTDNLFSEIKKEYADKIINMSDLEGKPELSDIIFKYLSLMERLSVGLNTKVYDLDVYARICRSKTINAWKQLEKIIEQRRVTASNTELYSEFETVVNNLLNWLSKPSDEKKENYSMLKSGKA